MFSRANRGESLSRQATGPVPFQRTTSPGTGASPGTTGGSPNPFAPLTSPRDQPGSASPFSFISRQAGPQLPGRFPSAEPSVSRPPIPANLYTPTLEPPDDVIPDEASAISSQASADRPRFVICIDYGTTYTGAAWALSMGEPLKLSDIAVVQNWGTGESTPKVPTLYTYTPNDGNYWGHGIGDNAFVIRWTKLELEIPTRLKALETLERTLSEARQLGFSPQDVVDNNVPYHLIKSSPEIMTDYISEVAKAVRADIEASRTAASTLLGRFPIDLVITHPAAWDARARSATFRAVNYAFAKFGAFPELRERPGSIFFVTEPEACAQYTAYTASEQGIGGLQREDCFVVVDAGGGTVDLVSYQVEEAAPNLKIRQITDATGSEVGATTIDRNFLNLVRRRLSPENYRKLMTLDNTRGGSHGGGSHVVYSRGEQFMIQRFEIIKHDFAGPPAPGQPRPRPFTVELPGDIGNRDYPEQGIEGGNFLVSYEELVDLFRDSIEGTIRLTTKQLTQISIKTGHSASAIFLSGGFSRNEYLYKRLNQIARQRGISLLRGNDERNDSWTAVCMGGVIMGLGMGCQPPQRSRKCPIHLGIVVSQRLPHCELENETYDLFQQKQKYTDSFDGKERAKNQIKWVVRRGDPIGETEHISTTARLVKKMSRTGVKKGTVKVVTSSYARSGKIPSQFSEAFLARDNAEVIDLDYDLVVLQQDPETYDRVMQLQGDFYRLVLDLEVTIHQRGVQLDLVCGQRSDMNGKIGVGGFRLCTRQLDLPTGTCY